MRIPIALLLTLALLPAGAAARPKPAPKPLTKPTWLRHVLVTEYFPAPESWFTGRRVPARGLAGAHRVDWLYSGRGVAMEGDGVGLNGERYHVDTLADRGWVNAAGRLTKPRLTGKWTRGTPFWRAVGWRNASGAVTFPLEGGGWFRGGARRYIDPAKVTFAAGPSLPLRYWKSVAVDAKLIPLGSRLFIGAFCKGGYGARSNGWFVAQDRGSAIKRRHLDVYRPAPASADGGDTLTDQRVLVLPPRAPQPRTLPSCAEQ
jgi:3D (Asp-Asp-Asp) domain-containing protein